MESTETILSELLFYSLWLLPVSFWLTFIYICQGVNTAVVVYDLEKIRTNEIFQAQIKIEAFEPLAAKYRVVGSLGMSDVTI
jgi:hypothetical protein